MSNIPISESNASFPGSRKKNIQQTQSNWRVQNLWKTLIICGDSPKLIIGSLDLDVCLDVQRETAGTIETTKQNKEKQSLQSLPHTCIYLYISPAPKKTTQSKNFNVSIHMFFILQLYVNQVDGHNPWGEKKQQRQVEVTFVPPSNFLVKKLWPKSRQRNLNEKKRDKKRWAKNIVGIAKGKSRFFFWKIVIGVKFTLGLEGQRTKKTMKWVFVDPTQHVFYVHAATSGVAAQSSWFVASVTKPNIATRVSMEVGN